VARGLADSIQTITFDFGNTLVPVDRTSMRQVVELTADRLVERLGPFDRDEVLRVWAEERERQFREELPRFREVDLAERFVRVLARLRGMRPPPEIERWDQMAAASLSSPDEIGWAVDVYSRAFVSGMPPREWVARLLERLAGRHRLGIVSNWPLAATVDHYAEAAGWSRHLAAIVVSQRVGSIKPHPEIFRAAEAALGLIAGDRRRILHVGDDWAADVVGAKGAGWQAALLLGRPDNSPLPASVADGSVEPDLELRSLRDLESALEPPIAVTPSG
jgi:FMN phosphatase YigB (HAD superfamily)